MLEGLKPRAEARVGLLLRGKWRLDRLLGVGGCAAVYAATHRAGKRVAVKILHPELAASPDICRRFLREAYAANAVEHPGVVSVLDDETTDEGVAFLVMDLLDGETLEARRKAAGGMLDPGEALSLADQILDVLAAAHAKNIIHRDLKPENLFLTREGQVRILDFGIARFRESSTETSMTEDGMTMGSPAFMPPEQARGRWELVDARTDLWSLGATLFTLLSGKFVHGGGTRNEALIASATKPAPSIATMVPSLPQAVAALVDRALAFEREARWPDAQAMREAVRLAYHAHSGGAGATVPLMAVPPLPEGPSGEVTTSGAWSSGQGQPSLQTSEPAVAGVSMALAVGEVGPGNTVVVPFDAASSAPKAPVTTTFSPEIKEQTRPAARGQRSRAWAAVAIAAGSAILVGSVLLLRSSGMTAGGEAPGAPGVSIATASTDAVPTQSPPLPSGSAPMNPVPSAPPTVAPADSAQAAASASALRPAGLPPPSKGRTTATAAAKAPPITPPKDTGAVIDLTQQKTIPPK